MADRSLPGKMALKIERPVSRKFNYDLNGLGWNICHSINYLVHVDAISISVLTPCCYFLSNLPQNKYTELLSNSAVAIRPWHSLGFPSREFSRETVQNKVCELVI